MSRPKYRRPRVLQELGFQCVDANGRAKVAFRSRAKAQQAIVSRNGTDVQLFSYECPRCAMWHHTSQAPRGRAE